MILHQQRTPRWRPSLHKRLSQIKGIMKWEGGVLGVINMWRCTALAPHLCRSPASEGAYLRYSAMAMSQPQQAWNNQTCVSMTTQPPGLHGGLGGLCLK